MELLEAILLGLIQGLTEFLPVSSSGHLELGKAILGYTPEEGLLFTVMLHLATALATLIVFREQVGQILRGLCSFTWNEETQYSLKIIASMVPAALVGVFFEDELSALFDGSVLFVGWMLLVTAALLAYADRAQSGDKKIGARQAVIIGIAQAIAILPGISRSGATIATALVLKTDKSQAAQFSFLMVVPLILGKVAKDLMEGTLTEASMDWAPIIAGGIAAFVSGWWACTWMVQLVRKSKLTYFAVYCAIAGAIAITVGTLVS